MTWPSGRPSNYEVARTQVVIQRGRRPFVVCLDPKCRGWEWVSNQRWACRKCGGELTQPPTVAKSPRPQKREKRQPSRAINFPIALPTLTLLRITRALLSPPCNPISRFLWIRPHVCCNAMFRWTRRIHISSYWLGNCFVICCGGMSSATMPQRQRLSELWPILEKEQTARFQKT